MIDERFRRALQASWSADTASVKRLDETETSTRTRTGTGTGTETATETATDVGREWSASNPAAGHCDVTSLLVRERIGGDLRTCQVFRNGVLSEHHYWNVLPDGQEVDLTRSQFDGNETFGEVATLTAEVFESAGPMNPELVERVARFRAAVDANLAVYD